MPIPNTIERWNSGSQPYPSFNLRRRLKRAGIGYAFAGEKLGGRPTDPGLYKRGAAPAGHADFPTLVDYPAVARQPSFQAGVDRLLELAAAGPTAMMCSEEDPNRCHRHHLIAQELLRRGVPVAHIRRDGRLEPAARVEPNPETLRLAFVDAPQPGRRASRTELG
jgi:uncharacterized protein (DUF488 family)